jgi:mannose-6-phosphate isomerase-like protein (cupin superfamily)
MPVYEFAQLLERRRASGQRYLEFLRTANESLSLGLYSLPAGGPDPQQPHSEDEVYYVVSGRGQIRVGEDDQAVGPGSIIFVAARVPHRFHSIAEDLEVVVFFAPAESQ